MMCFSEKIPKSNDGGFMLSLIIFDMDGVLVDSEPAITYASMESLAEAGIKVEYEDFKPFTGMGDDRFIEGAAGKYGYAYDVKYKERAYEIYIDKKDRVRVFPTSKKLISELVSCGYKCSVASASDIIKVKTNLSCIGIESDVFASLVTGSDVKNKKPDPEIFLKAASIAGIDSSACLVIEDAVSGVMAAKAAGMIAVGVTTSFDRETLISAGADFVIGELYEAFDIINGLSKINS